MISKTTQSNKLHLSHSGQKALIFSIELIKFNNKFRPASCITFRGNHRQNKIHLNLILLELKANGFVHGDR